MKPGKHQRKVHGRAQYFLFSVHTLCMNYVTNTFLLVSPQYGVNNYFVLCMVRAKEANKNVQQRTFSGCIRNDPNPKSVVCFICLR